jgi:hypothetical protein
MDAFHERGPVREALAERAELHCYVAAGQDRNQAPAADHVDHREVLGDADRVVQRRDQRGDHDAHAPRARGDRRREHQRRGQVAVGRAVVLGDAHAVEAHAVRPGALLERRGEELLGSRATPRGAAQVVADREGRHAWVVLP